MDRSNGSPSGREEGESGKTKYYVLMEELKSDIIAGRLRPGDKLPSENEPPAPRPCDPPYGAKGAVHSGAGGIYRSGARQRDLCLQKN